MNKEDYRNELQPRQVTLQLSDVQCEEVLKLCGKCGLTISELFECFLVEEVAELLASGGMT